VKKQHVPTATLADKNIPEKLARRYSRMQAWDNTLLRWSKLHQLASVSQIVS